MEITTRPCARRGAIGLAILLALSARVQAFSANPDLTAGGAIAALKADANASPRYARTYNLGATGLRGWIYIDSSNLLSDPAIKNSADVGQEGRQTALSRQILVTVASAPGNAVLAVDDVILGAMAASTGTVPLFTSDCRKAIGLAIGDAEKTGAGTLRVKRWRAGDIADVNIAMTIMGDYATSAPYSCPKSTAILAAARTRLVTDVLANPNFYLTSNYGGAITGLALLAGVQPGDPNYAAVQTQLQTFARSLASTGPRIQGLDMWHWGYISLFLSEYYLSTGDANVVSGLNQYTIKLAQSQSMYGTFGHDPALVRPDGTGRRSTVGYGALNQCGLPANIALVLGKKALVTAGQPVDPSIDPAIQRGSDFFASYVNKGGVPYGEHLPVLAHASNGKDPACAVLFGIQDNSQPATSTRLAETEYFSRLALAGFPGREYGHTGVGFSYFWEALGANMGGPEAVARYLQQVRWSLDLERRTDGSFVYDGAEYSYDYYGAGTTEGGTYLGFSGCYYSLPGAGFITPTASYLLAYSLPLQRLYITGKNSNPAHNLATTKIDNAIAAATFKQDCVNYTTTQLIAALSEFDPLVRNDAANQLGTRTLSGTELTTLRGMVTGSDANARMGACQVLGLFKDTTALPTITQRLDKTVETNSWVRANAATALRWYDPATASAQLTPMLSAFTTNATDPDVIVWDDPIQLSNGCLGFALFGDAIYGYQVNGGANLGAYTINAAKNLLYPAVQAGLKQPDSYTRQGVSDFVYNSLTQADVQALPQDIINLAAYECQADRMWSGGSRTKGIQTMAKFKFAETIPVALAMLETPVGFGFEENYQIPALNVLAGYGDAARWTLPTLYAYRDTWDHASSKYAPLLTTIATIEAATSPLAGITNLNAVATPQVVATIGAKAITLTGTSCRDASVSFTNVTAPAHGTLSGIPPNLTYTPAGGYTGTDSFTFQVTDSKTTSDPGTVSIIVGTAGTGLKGEYYDNMDFTNLKFTRTDAQVNFDWGTGSPDALIGPDTFSVRWNGLLLVPETATYKFSTLNSDGVRLYVSGVLVIDEFSDNATHWKDGSSVNLTAGQMVEVQMQYYENTGSAVAKLKWTGPSFAGVNGAVIGSQWLFDGTGMTRTPYAHAQSLTLMQNTAQVITLTGSGGSLAYAVVTQPSHGVLTGTAPNLTYTPATNYNGADSFTFLVNNGTGNSAPATVTLGIMAGLPSSYNWSSATSGNWSVAGNWTPDAPAATGQANYFLNFTPAGTYTVTHDLNNGFQVNQLNFAGAVTLAGTNSIAPTANGSVLPQINQNSGNTVNINTPLSLASTTTFGGTGSGQTTLNGLLSGTGGIFKSSPGTLTVTGLKNNTYSGGTAINSGKIYVYDVRTFQGLGTGTITLNGGILHLDRSNLSNNMIVNGGSVLMDNGYGSLLAGPITNNAGLNVDVWYVNQPISGVISGTGGITMTSQYGGQLVLSATNTYTGPTRVVSGTLTCSTSSSLGTGTLDISTGAKAALNYTGTRTIAGLTLGGTAMAAGTYGSTSSTATNKNDTWFSGTGTVTAGAPNSAPVATPQSVSTTEDTAKPITLTATDANGNPLTYSVVRQPAHGTLSGSPPNVTYAPMLHYNGSDSFTFKANDGTLDSASAAVSITVTAVNDAPMAAAQSVTAGQGAAKAITLTGTDVEGSALTYAIVAPPAHGTLSGTPPNVTYTSNANYSGFDGFTFKANDGTLDSTPAPVSITVVANSAPVATSRSVTTTKNIAKTITLAGSDVEGSTLTYAIVTPPAHGTLSGMPPNVTFTPTTDYTGPDSFTFKVNDGLLDSPPATVSITVTDGSSGQLTWGAPTAITGAGNIKSAGVSNLAGANFGITSGTTTTVPASETGTVSVEFRSLRSGQNVTLSNGINVAADSTWGNWGFASGNSAVAGNFGIVLDSNLGIETPGATAATVTLSNLTVGAQYRFQFFTDSTGSNSQTISGSAAINSQNGQFVAGTFTADATSRVLTVTRNSSFAVVNALTIGIVDTPPTLASIVDDRSGGPVAPNTLATYTVTFSKDMDANTVSAADFGNAGTSAIAIGMITETTPGVFTVPVTPTSTGTLQLKINAGAVLNDATGNAMDTTSAIIDDTTITVRPVNTAPVANSQSISTAVNTPSPITLSVSDAESDPLTYVLINAPAHGTLIGTGPNVTYAPVPDYIGPDSFTFKVNDGILDSAEAMVSILVTTPSPTTVASSPGVTVVYGSTVTFTAMVTGPTYGTVTFKDGGTILGTGTLDSGTATFATNTLAAGSHSITAGYDGDPIYNSSVSSALNFTVTAKPLSITGVTASNKIYDGTTAAVLTGGAVSGGLVGSDVVTMAPGSGAFSSANVGTWAVTASGYSLGGAAAGNYTLSVQPTVPNASITARPIQLTGTRVYDGTTTAAANVLTISNNVDGGNLTLSGSTSLGGKDVGAQAIQSVFATPFRVQSAKGNTGSGNSTSINVNLASTPTNGNTLVAVISTRGTSAGRVSAISGGGVTWSRVSQAANTNGSTMEIWYGPGVSTGTTGITITQANLRSAAVVMEYNGLLTPASVDLAANNTGNSNAPVTGTTATFTNQANELWIGGIGIVSSTPTLSAVTNSFAAVDNAVTTSNTAGNNARVYALERIVTATGSAFSGGNLSATAQWSGAIATFKARSLMNLSISGSAAANYTLTGFTGEVTITPKNLAVSGLATSNRMYDATTAAALTGTAALLTAQAPGAGTTSDGKPYTGDTLTLGGTANGTFADKHAASNKPVSVTGITLGGAQAGDYNLIQQTGLTASVTQLPITVTAVSATKTYDGTTTASGPPTCYPALASGDSTTVLFQTFASAAAGTTNKVIIPSITINDGNSGANYAVTLVNYTTGTINKAPATVTLGGLSQTYDGSPKSATAITDPAGKSVTLTYNGSTTAPTAIGNYTVNATINDSNYSGNATSNLVIAAQSITEWQNSHFTSTEISNGLADDNADADGDGLTNRSEYALGTDPRSSSQQPLAIAQPGGGQFTLSFLARRATGTGYAGLTRKYTVESTANPANPASWQPVTGYTNLVGGTQTSNIVGDDQTVTVTVPANAAAQFYRLNVRVE